MPRPRPNLFLLDITTNFHFSCLQFFYLEHFCAHFVNISDYFLKIDSQKWNFCIKVLLGFLYMFPCCFPGTCQLTFLPEVWLPTGTACWYSLENTQLSFLSLLSFIWGTALPLVLDTWVECPPLTSSRGWSSVFHIYFPSLFGINLLEPCDILVSLGAWPWLLSEGALSWLSFRYFSLGFWLFCTDPVASFFSALLSPHKTLIGRPTFLPNP